MPKRPSLDLDRFRVPPGSRVDLADWSTTIAPLYDSNEAYQKLLEGDKEDLKRYQELLYAHNRYALLVIFQAMDAGGKDGVIRHVTSGLNPQGCQVHSFKHPSERELEHDFLWRAYSALPERGQIGIFNRSYYEEVLIVRVRPAILAAQKLPDAAPGSPAFWEGRYRSINDAEAHLHRNGTRILKFFLHLSREEQRRRFLDRIDKPHKNWKLSPADLEQRRHWDDYMAAYADCLAATSSIDAPWYVVPADDKKNARLIVAQAIVGALATLDLHFPRMGAEEREALQRFRQQLAAEGE
ncbi:MAG TPA: phosphate--nucleotide phosphotransferase [Gammaproteobacteria bacterium]|nr:phosphate--nucleotide phosphotransferase [Gammaproteobacteria bacterium]